MISPETAVATAGRRGRLARTLETHGVDALLVGHDVDIRYLSGFIGDDSILLAAPDRTWIVTDPRYDEYLDPWREVDALDVVMGVRHRLEETVRSICAEHGLARIGIQAEHVTVLGRRRLVDALGPVAVTETESVVPRLRQRKDADEVDAIERAISVQEASLAAALDQLQLGMREVEFAAVLEYEMRRRGSSASFSPIIATGANSSVIHYTTGATPIENGCLLIDWGATSGFHCSDMTRTFAVGEMPDRLAGIYEIVLEAQGRAIEACRPGRTCAEIDAVAREIITTAGFGECFGHGLGHGLGLEVHETPYFNDLETTTRLEPGMVMTVEPGIYVPGIGGVRIEDDVLITETGARVLGSYPKSPEDMVVEPGAGASAPTGVTSA